MNRQTDNDRSTVVCVVSLAKVYARILLFEIIASSQMSELNASSKTNCCNCCAFFVQREDWGALDISICFRLMSFSTFRIMCSAGDFILCLCGRWTSMSRFWLTYDAKIRSSRLFYFALYFHILSPSSDQLDSMKIERETIRAHFGGHTQHVSTDCTSHFRSNIKHSRITSNNNN